MKLSENERQLLFIFAALIAVALFYCLSVRNEIIRNERIEQEVAAYQESVKPFLSLALDADAFAIYDMDTHDFVYKKGAERTMPLASLTKVMSAIVIMEHVPADHIFTISEEALKEAGDNKLLVDERWNRDELLKFSLVESSNDALWEMARETGAIMDPSAPDSLAVFVAAMNAKAQELKLHGLTFKNPSGLDVGDGTNGGYGTARSIAKLFAYALETYPDIFAPTREAAPVFHSESTEHVAKNTNPFTREIAGLIASKTGFTNISGGNLTVAVQVPDGRRLVLVVLGSTFDARFTDIQTISGTVQNPQPVAPSLVE